MTKKCLSKIGGQASLQRIFLMSDGWKKAQPILGSVGLGGIRKQGEQVLESKLHLCVLGFSFCLDFPLRQTAT